MVIINLNKNRKAKAKADAKAQADANAVKFGRTKGEKLVERAEAEKAKRGLDWARRD